MTEEDLKDLESSLFFSPLPPKAEALVTQLITAYREQTTNLDQYQEDVDDLSSHLYLCVEQCKDLERQLIDEVKERTRQVTRVNDLKEQLADAREELKKATGCICGEDHYPDGED